MAESGNGGRIQPSQPSSDDSVPAILCPGYFISGAVIDRLGAGNVMRMVNDLVIHEESRGLPQP